MWKSENVKMLNMNVTFLTLALFFGQRQKIYPKVSSLINCPLAQETFSVLPVGKAQVC